MQISLFSFFSGAGFLDLGFEDAGFQVDFVNEIHSPFLEAYKHSRTKLDSIPPRHGYYDCDIVKFLNSKSWALREMVWHSRRATDLVGFVGGPPCPDFSVGGKNKGRKGDKGKLSEAYIQIITQQRPDFFVFENVKGLWRTKKHRAFYEELKQQLTASGYVLTEKLINSIEYDVPQDRERIILIGFQYHVLRDLGIEFESNAKCMPDGIFPWNEHISRTVENVFNRPWPETAPYDPEIERDPPSRILKSLTVEHWFHVRNKTDEHPNSVHHFKPRAGLSKFQSVDEGDVSRKSYKRLHRWRYSPTAAYGNNEVHIHPYRPRRLTVAEALAIQSLPKQYELPADMSLTDMFKTIGNGVPYLAAKGLARTIQGFVE